MKTKMVTAKMMAAMTVRRSRLRSQTPEPAAELYIEDGRLSDIAPTILAMMGVERPAEMTGRVLVKE